MDKLEDELRRFNSHSRDTKDHFKLCATGREYEVRLCSSHPRFVTCTADTVQLHIRSTGPSLINLSLYHDQASLQTLLTLLKSHQDDNDSILEWELEDWVSAGYPCRLYTTQDQPNFPDLGFMPEDLWCIDEQPNRRAFI